MRIPFNDVISESNEMSGNYIIFSDDGTPLYSGHSNAVHSRLSVHRSRLRKAGRFHCGINVSVRYNDDWYAETFNLGSNVESRLELEELIHEEIPTLLSNAGDKHTGKSLSTEHRQKLSGAKLGKPREAIRGEKHHFYGKKLSDDIKRKMSEGARRRPVVTCPHCGLEGKGGAMTRYHFDNCKMK